jgi:hypothetical protein
MAEEETRGLGVAGGPKRRRARKEKRRKATRPEKEWYWINVRAAAARVSRVGPGLWRDEPDGISETTLQFEGELEKPVLRMTTTALMVMCRNDRDHPGAAIGGREIWRLVVSLPRPPFDDLVALVAAQRVAKIELLIENLKFGKGRVRSVAFSTTPIPSEAEEEWGGEVCARIKKCGCNRCSARRFCVWGDAALIRMLVVARLVELNPAA